MQVIRFKSVVACQICGINITLLVSAISNATG